MNEVEVGLIPMKFILSILLSVFSFSTLLFGQSERPETIVIPVSSLGEVSEVRKQILQNTLEDELKSHFRLISQERFEEVQEKVFEELEYDECTEEQCIVMIQEMLQVENVFHLQVLGEGDDTQLSLSWKTLDEKKKETDVCMGCGTFQLNEKVGGLVGKLVGVKKENLVKEEIINVSLDEVRKPEVIEKSFNGILFYRKVNRKWDWFKDGNEKIDRKWVGEINNGVPNGQGTWSWNNLKYVGKFKDGKRNGKGTFYSSSGTKYEGEWKDGKKQGYGSITYPDGIKYEGEWKNGKKDGKGTFTKADGTKYIGEFKRGTYWNIIVYDKNGNITGKWENGNKLRN